jgi:hypothetical protein
MMQPGSINHLLARCAKKAGIEKHVRSHAMRRTTNNLLRRTAGELVARKVTGHVTQQMTEHYSEVDHEERVTALNGAFGVALLPSTNENDVEVDVEATSEKLTRESVPCSSASEVQPVLVDEA